MLKLIGFCQITSLEHLLDLPIKPERSLIEQGAIVAGAVLLEVLIRILARGQMQHPQLELPLQGQLLHLTDGPVGGPHPGTVCIEIEHDAFAVTAATELGDLLTAEGRPQGGDCIGNSGRMECDHIEIALHHNGAVVLTDRIGSPIQAKKMLALLKHLRFRGIEVFRFRTIQAAATKPDHAALPVADRHHHPMTETVIEAVAALTGHDESSRFQQFGRHPLHLLQMAQQTIPLIGGIAKFKTLEGGLTQPSRLTQIGQRLSADRLLELTAEPSRRQG